MSQTETLAALAGVLEEVSGVDPAEVTVEKTLVDDLELDSLAMVEVTVAVDDTLGVHIPDDALTGLRTVGDVVSYIEENRVRA